MKGLVCCLLLVGAVALAAPAERGRVLYRQGAANAPACIGCHGRHGEGKREGGIEAPPLRQWRVGLEAAVNGGRDGGGRALHRLMPRYRYSSADLASLQAYLGVIGTDAEPGLEPGLIRIGAAMPGGEAALAARIAAVNAGGGIYGRQLELVAQAPMFAFLGEGPPATPSVGMLAPAPAESAWGFGVLPSWQEQVSALAEQAATHGGALVLAFDDSTPPGVLDAARGALARLGKPACELVDLHLASAVRQCALGPRLREDDGAVLYLGAAQRLGTVFDTGAPPTPVYALALQMGAVAFQMAPSAAARLRLAMPAGVQGKVDIAGKTADASAAILIEALKRGGREIDQAGLVEALQGLRAVRVDGMPTLGFGPNRRAATSGMYMVGIDAARTRYVPYSGVFDALAAP